MMMGNRRSRIIETRRRAKFITPIPKPKKRKGAAKQEGFVFEDAAGLSTRAAIRPHLDHQ
jgi:type III restriction enzyme